MVFAFQRSADTESSRAAASPHVTAGDTADTPRVTHGDTSRKRKHEDAEKSHVELAADRTSL